jgi:hypothetical protein
LFLFLAVTPHFRSRGFHIPPLRGLEFAGIQHFLPEFTNSKVTTRWLEKLGEVLLQ